MNLRNLSLAAGITAVAVSAPAQKAPEPCELTPNVYQVGWYNREIIVFSYFGVSTFEGYVNEGGERAPAAVLNLMALDCGQWMHTPQSTSAPSVIITTKYTDDSCLWLSRYTDYGVENPAWRNGRGDVVHEFVDVYEEHGIKTGVYLGPRDRHEHLSSLYTTEGHR